MESIYNAPLAAAILSWFIAQLLKVLISIIKNGKLSLERFLGAGGMPSSHSAAVCALAAGLAVSEGLNSPLFALAFILAFIVMYDASGVRRAAGIHAREINKIKDAISDIIMKRNVEEKKQYLKEFLGHSPLEVFFGAIFGIVMGILFTVYS
ncbi:MAG: divergent PAP2 family protein [Oscillospiraceae bacterium]|jgi:acid phosphatase family membrane protein YuiD|nr:divergent PAP2 family protein [Oscillospiraceae bacterium]